jgi:glycerol uptake facilitator-like aquaporin
MIPPKHILQEFIGTAILVFVIIVTNNPLMIGLTLTIILLSLAGPGVNPVVSAMTYKGSNETLLIHMAAQFAGGYAGMLASRFV